MYIADKISGPETISIWMVSPKYEERGTGEVFLAFFLKVAKFPLSKTASAGVESNFTFPDISPRNAVFMYPHIKIQYKHE